VLWLLRGAAWLVLLVVGAVIYAQAVAKRDAPIARSQLPPIEPSVYPEGTKPPRVADLAKGWPVEKSWRLVSYEAGVKVTVRLLSDWQHEYEKDMATWVDIGLEKSGEYASDEPAGNLLTQGIGYQHRQIISKAIFAKIDKDPSGFLAVEYSYWIK
jgi:hypothetical protein